MESALIPITATTMFYDQTKDMVSKTIGLCAELTANGKNNLFALSMVKQTTDKVTKFKAVSQTCRLVFSTPAKTMAEAIGRLAELVKNGDGLIRSNGTANKVELSAVDGNAIYEYVATEKNQKKGCRKTVIITPDHMALLAVNAKATKDFNLALEAGNIGLTGGTVTTGATSF